MQQTILPLIDAAGFTRLICIHGCLVRSMPIDSSFSGAGVRSNPWTNHKTKADTIDSPNS